MSALHYYFPPAGDATPREIEVDLCAYGAGPAGITAAIRAAACGRSVALITNSSRLGGLTAGGLGNTDIGNKAAIGGLARTFYQRLGRHYGTAEEWRFEPHAAEKVFHEMLTEAGIEPLLREFPSRVDMSGHRIRALHFESGLVVRAAYFLDASYEGDLMALAGVSHFLGREANDVHGELLSGVQLREQHQFEFPVDPYVREGDPASGLLPGICPEPLAAQGSGDRKIQAYNFRSCLTQSADRLPFFQPDGYDPRRYELLARYFRGGFRRFFRKFNFIRNGKTDTNNYGAFSTDLIGGNWSFPEAGYAGREAVFQDHVNYQAGLFWFVAHDPSVPPEVRARMQSWGLAPDEFTDTGGWPHQLYIREARRLVSDFIITEADCRGWRKASDPVGLGAYTMDSHNCQRVVVHGCVRNEGDVQVGGFPPYPISYRSIIPKRGEAENLFVPVCLAASHIAYGSARMEPVFMILGESAALAADLALSENEAAVQDVNYGRLRARLSAAGQVLEWTEASPSGSEDAEPVYAAHAPPPV